MKIAAEIIKYLSISLTFICFSYIILIFITELSNLRKSGSSLLNFPKRKKNKTSNILRFIIPNFLLSRAIIFFTTYFFHVYFTNEKVTFFNSFKQIWNKWDSPHYLSIAQYGYQTINDERFFIVFYPLYPFLVKIINFIISDYFFSGIFVSNLIFVVGLYYLYRLIELDFQEDDIALSTVNNALIFPFSFFFSIVYTESLFFTLSVMTFYFGRRRLWTRSGFCGMLAALTRNQGLVLVIPITIEIILETDILTSIKNREFKKCLILLGKSFPNIMLIPIGTFIYLLINRIITEDWFKFLVYQKEHWYQGFGFFANNLYNHFLNIFRMDTKFIVGIWLPQILLFFIVILLLIYAYNKIRISYIAYSFVYIIISYSPTWLLSGPRYLTSMFTLFLMLSVFVNKNKILKFMINFSMILLLILYSLKFYLGSVY